MKELFEAGFFHLPTRIKNVTVILNSMTKEELVALAAKVREGKATVRETETFFRELKKKTADLKEFVASLPKVASRT
jgi:hypothetical protein